MTLMPSKASAKTLSLRVRGICGPCPRLPPLRQRLAAIAKQRTQVTQHASPQAKPSDIAFTIKWNPRSTPVKDIARTRSTDTATQWVQLRAGKRQCMWEESRSFSATGTS